MARIIKSNGQEIEVAPKNGTDFKLEELQEIVGGYIEIVGLGKEIMVLNENGRILHLPYNQKASDLWGDIIVGDVLVCDSEMVE